MTIFKPATIRGMPLKAFEAWSFVLSNSTQFRSHLVISQR
jgi:hypothetical protein